MAELKCDNMWARIMTQFGKVDPTKRTLMAVFQFNVRKNGRLRKIITVDCKNLRVIDGAIDDPDAVLEIEDDALLDCAKHDSSILQCIKERRASVTGDLKLFEQLNNKFPK